MSFKTKKVKSQTLGEYLRECRETSDLSLSDLAKFSQIQPKYILALEEGRYEDLPAAVYVKGFLKSLGRIYHCREDKLLVQYAAEQEIAKNIEKTRPDLPKINFSAPKLIFSPKTLVLGMLGLFGVISISYLYFQVSSLRRPPKLELISPKADAVVASAGLQVAGKTEPGSTVYLNNQTIVVDAKGEFRESLSLTPGSNVLIIRSVNKFGQETTLTRTLTYREKEIAGAATGTLPTLLSEEIILEVVLGSQAAWISIEVDGEDEYIGTMLPHARRTVKAKERIVLSTNNAGATFLILNGKDLGFLGKEGEVIREIEFTK